MALRIISRAEWGARAPTSITRTTWAERIGMAFHYSSGNPASTPRDLQDYAMNNLGYSDTHYNFFVDRRGIAYEGRGWLVVAAHAYGQNKPWVGICFIGRDEDVTPEALATMRDLYDEACRLAGRKLRFSGHGQLPGQSTSCPGSKIKNWIAQGMPRPSVGGPSEEDEMKAVHGQKGENVAYLQRKLKQLDPGALPKFGVDKDYGDETAQWVARLLTGGDGRTVDGEWFARLDEKITDKKVTEAAGPGLPSSVKISIPATSVVIPASEITVPISPS